MDMRQFMNRPSLSGINGYALRPTKSRGPRSDSFCCLVFDANGAELEYAASDATGIPFERDNPLESVGKVR